MQHPKTNIDIPIIIRPTLKKACCEGDACRAALYGALLYSIAWKKKCGEDYWYGSQKEICGILLDDSWGLSKVIKEINALVSQSFIEQRRNPNFGWDQKRQYLFGPEQAAKFRETCKKAKVCVHKMGFGPEVLHLLKITNAFIETNDCICQKQQIQSLETTNPIVENNEAIPEDTNVGYNQRIPTEDTTEVPSATSVAPAIAESNDSLYVSPVVEKEKGQEEEQPTLLEVEGPPIMPPPTAKWVAETLVQYHEARRGKRYSEKLRGNAKKTQRQRMLEAGKKIIKQGIIREKYEKAVERRDNKWWQEHNGELTPEHMAANTKNHIMRILEVLEQIESFQIVTGAPAHSTPPEAKKFGYQAPQYSQLAYESPLSQQQMAATMAKIESDPEFAALVAAVE